MVLAEILKELDQRGIIHGDLSSFQTYKYVQMEIRDRLDLQDKAVLSDIVTNLIRGSIHQDEDGHFIPHVLSLTIFNDNYGIENESLRHLIKDTTEYHLNRYENLLKKTRDTHILNDAHEKLGQLTETVNVYEVLDREISNRNQQRYKREFKQTAENLRWLKGELDFTKKITKIHKPDVIHRNLIIRYHSTLLFNLLLKSISEEDIPRRALYHAKSWAQHINTDDPDNFTKRVLKNYQNRKINTKDTSMLERIVMKTAIETKIREAFDKGKINEAAYWKKLKMLEKILQS